jgi:hypothetical protein
MSVADNKQIYDLINFIADQSFSYVDAATGGGLVGKTVASLGTITALLSPKILVMGILTVLFKIVEPTLLFIRYALLSFLYIFGPLAFVSAIFPPTRRMLKGWFINLFQISFWIVTLRILELILVSLQLQDFVAKGYLLDVFPWAVICFTFVVFIVATPFITAKVLSGENLGATASMIVGAVAVAAGHAGILHSSLTGNATVKPHGAHLLTHHTGTAIRHAVSGAKEIVKKSIKSIKSRPSGKQSGDEAPRR